MEPVSLAFSFATIVGLMADFASSRGQNDVLEIKEFTEWLRTHGHDEIIEHIQRNTQTTISIKASLAEGRTELLARLAAIENLLAALSSGQGPIGELALATSPKSTLSPQAVQILVGFEQAKAGKALLSHTFQGSHLLFLDGAGSHGFAPTDPRFFEADLDELLANDLCSISFNGSGGKIFHLTRRGSRVAQEIIGRS